MIPSDGEVVAVSHPIVGSGVSASGSEKRASSVRVDGFPSISKQYQQTAISVSVPLQGSKLRAASRREERALPGG
ncbi:hypothetical protein [Nostoc sp.]|uniref:hypothetical protein n=1 Tax=Nostoc sp. TaxID=1180 RepID=UPI002FFAFBEA